MRHTLELLVADWGRSLVGTDRRGRQPSNRTASRIPDKVRSDNTLENQIALNTSLQNVNQIADTNYGYMGNAGLGSLEARMSRANKIAGQVNDLYAENDGYGMPMGSWGNQEYAGRGLYAGNGLNVGQGLYAGRGLYAGSGEGLYAGTPYRASGGQLGGRQQPVLPPALQSQPYSQNFQFQHTLPPAYQNIGDRAGGRGLYAGGGLMEQQVARVANRLAGNDKRVAGNQGKVKRRGRKKSGKGLY